MRSIIDGQYQNASLVGNYSAWVVNHVSVNWEKNQTKPNFQLPQKCNKMLKKFIVDVTKVLCEVNAGYSCLNAMHA